MFDVRKYVTILDIKKIEFLILQILFFDVRESAGFKKSKTITFKYQKFNPKKWLRKFVEHSPTTKMICLHSTHIAL